MHAQDLSRFCNNNCGALTRTYDVTPHSRLRQCACDLSSNETVTQTSGHFPPWLSGFIRITAQASVHWASRCTRWRGMDAAHAQRPSRSVARRRRPRAPVRFSVIELIYRAGGGVFQQRTGGLRTTVTIGLQCKSVGVGSTRGFRLVTEGWGRFFVLVLERPVVGE